MTKLCIKIYMKSDSAIESAFPQGYKTYKPIKKTREISRVFLIAQSPATI